MTEDEQNTEAIQSLIGLAELIFPDAKIMITVMQQIDGDDKSVSARTITNFNASRIPEVMSKMATVIAQNTSEGTA